MNDRISIHPKICHDPSVITARTTYGETFAASAARGRAAGVQFHPEKSQAIGLAILRNFIALVPFRSRTRGAERGDAARIAQ